ncbi:MAG: 6,7-dimethyl-8-ribityllumazine synthase [Candidatus Marinimicrobia bacterium]|nr:6,7-dimethyl-8-ribityllumazine synthase [Candidatus Neomarinimicrobiota bacterium]|tara:strand:- start:41450 stop:41872 length:423 start_codon:yes stop_codon:yes gene_type:complete
MIGIVVSEFNQAIVEGLLSGCKKALLEKEIDDKSIIIKKVPGAFEIPAAVNSLITIEEIEIVITLGAVIKGQTDHYHYIAKAVTNGVMQITLESNIPIIFGVLTCQTLALAQERSSIQNMSCNKGYEAGKVALSMIYNST